jgi:hypothetical protein
VKFRCLISDFSSQFPETSLLQSSGPIPPIIWICWWDGIDAMPPLVKACYNSVLKYSKSFAVNLVTKYNFREFLTIPEHIIKKMEVGIITITGFSDVLRMSLLSEYGGLWLDSTILVTSNIHLDEKCFFTIKRESGGDAVPQRRWTGFCIGGIRNIILFKFVKEFLCAYWGKYNHLPDYFLIDYIITIAYGFIPQIKQLIDNVRYNNPDLYIIQDNLGNEATPDFFTQIGDDTIFHKLTWKKKYAAVTDNDRLTVYGWILKTYGD